MRRSGRSNFVVAHASRFRSCEFAVRPLAAVQPTAFFFCAVQLAMPLRDYQTIFTEGSEGNKDFAAFRSSEIPSLFSFPSVYVFVPSSMALLRVVWIIRRGSLRIAPDPVDSEPQTVVFLMSADPKPRDDVAFAQTKRAIVFSDANDTNPIAAFLET